MTQSYIRLRLDCIHTGDVMPEASSGMTSPTEKIRHKGVEDRTLSVDADFFEDVQAVQSPARADRHCESGSSTTVMGREVSSRRS